MASKPGICLRNIALTLSGHTVFTDLSLSLDEGQWHCILGRSGAGKSSLLRIMAGLQQPDHGTVTALDNRPPGQCIAHMSQDDNLLPWLTALDNVQLGPRLRGITNKQTQQRAHDLLSQVGLHNWASSLPERLSGGMRQRVALARTLMEERPIVLMDEPFSRLDAVTRNELQTLSNTLLKGCTVVLVTHDPQEALRMGHTITVLNHRKSDELATRRLQDSPLREFDSPAFIKHLPELWETLQDEELAL